MLDMNKAFDTVIRRKLLNYLKEILNEDELQFMNILIKYVNYKVCVDGELGKYFITKTGIAQGDCLSATLFTLYLA